MLLDVQHLCYLPMCLSIDDKEVEHRATAFGQLCHQLEQLLLRQSATCKDNVIVIIGHLLQSIVHLSKQRNEAVFLPKIIHRLGNHYLGEPGGQSAFAPEREVCENLDEAIMQHIQRIVHTAGIAVADGHQLLGIAPIEQLSGSIISCPTPSYQLLLIFQSAHCLLPKYLSPHSVN